MKLFGLICYMNGMVLCAQLTALAGLGPPDYEARWYVILMSIAIPLAWPLLDAWRNKLQ